MAGRATQQGPPPGWTHFFPAAEYNIQDRRALLVKELLPLFSSEEGVPFLSRLQQVDEGAVALPLNSEAFQAFCGLEYLGEAVTEQPEEALACVSIACHQVLMTAHKDLARRLLGHACEELAPPKIRIHNHGKEIFIRQLQGSSIGRLVTIRGTVVRMGVIRPLAIQMDFVCGKCAAKITARFPEGKFTPPTRCSEQGCRSKTFTPNRSSAKCLDWRTIRVQEIVGADKQQAGQVPRTMQVELWEDLVGSCMVGDVVVVTGVVKVLASGDDLSKLGNGKGQKQDLFVMYLEAHSVLNPSSSAGGRQTKAQRQLTQQQQQQQQTQQQTQQQAGGVPPNMTGFTDRDLEFIAKFTEEYDGDQLRTLVQSLCPSICGHELVKAGLLLALFGGVRKNAACANHVPTRGDIHVLVVGDPGLGKSQLLQAAASAAPRGVYVCGKTSSSAGLTVSVVRDALTGDFVFEAGAVVLADRGACCIDEFDKMVHEHQALLEAMEQQEVSVAKAGLVASLPARTSILAAANPVGGHYNRAKSVCENLKMSAAILSRFDLVFILLDRPDEAMDQCVSEHVLALHSGIQGKAQAARQRLLEFRPTQQQLTGQADPGGTTARLKLSQRLLLRAEDDEQGQLPAALLRKYIAYARQYVHPRLSDDARTVLQAFYLQLRAQVPGGVGASSMPVTARQLESMVRLAEARARCELREEVTREDAEDVVEIMREALYDRFVDDIACVDFRPGGGASSRAGSKAAESKRFLTALRRQAERQGRDTFSGTELHSFANEISLQVKDVTAFIEQLNEGGDILKAGSGQYKIRGLNPAVPAASGAGPGGYSQGGTQATQEREEGWGPGRAGGMPNFGGKGARANRAGGRARAATPQPCEESEVGGGMEDTEMHDAQDQGAGAGNGLGGELPSNWWDRI